jgi:3-oxoacyl-[acyl-carrier protein] reductase
MDTALNGSVVLVTGGAGGIGSAICRAFAAEGATVAIHHHTSAAAAEALADEIHGVALRADLRIEAEADALIPAVVDELGALDVCVANAGAYSDDGLPIWEMPLERWDETIRANLTTAFLTARAFLRRAAVTGRGSLVFVASTSGLFGETGRSDYSAAKAAISGGLLLTLKNEAVRLGPGVRVNAVAPGWTATPSRVAAGIPEEHFAAATATMALKKLATPQDVAAAVVALASDVVSGHVTGQVVTVAGGMEGRLVR